MKQTEKLYDLDAYRTEFEGTVLSCEKIVEKEKDVYQVILDKTLFFPEEGGQSPDKGTIQGKTVIDVQIKEEVITHTLLEPIEIGEVVHGVIDWKHRFSNMQQHSGEHIFSGLVNQKFGYDNVGFHLSDQIVTMDFNGVLSAEEASEIEYAANEVIAKNLPIQVSFPTKEELEQLEYRSKIEIEGQVRIVTIPETDVCACCAPHVRRTGEIGLLKIISLQNHRGGVRISILCGFRALEDYRKRIAVISQLSASLSANLETLPEAVEKIKAFNQSLKTELVDSKKAYMEARIEAIPETQENVYLFEKNLDAQDMRGVVNQLVSNHVGVCGIFVGDDTEGYRFIMGSSAMDVRTVMAHLKETLEVKGGGSAAMVQGSVVAKKETLMELLNTR